MLSKFAVRFIIIGVLLSFTALRDEEPMIMNALKGIAALIIAK